MFNKSLFGLKKNASFLIILLFIFSCKDDVKPLEFKNTFIENNFEADIEVAFEKAEENSDTAKTINKNIVSEILKAIPTSKNETSIKAALTNFENDFKTFKNDFPEIDQTWTLAIETEVLYKTENVITMGLSVYSDTGGAHGNDSIRLLNFNPENGELFTNKKLFNNIEGFKTLAEIYFLDHMKNEGTDINEFFYGKDFQLPENIGFNDEGIILLYNTYEIASYSQGFTEFVIPTDKAKKFLIFDL